MIVFPPASGVNEAGRSSVIGGAGFPETAIESNRLSNSAEADMVPRCLAGLLLVALVAADAKVPGSELTAEEKATFELTNKARAENKLQPLTLNAVLIKAARAHSANMAKQGKMSHVLDDKNPADRVKEAGYKYSLSGENLAVSDNVPTAVIFESWMKSKAHRENILREEFRDIGMGVVRAADGKLYYTQVFGAPPED
jgi:uncharacterized protein YkwD